MMCLKILTLLMLLFSSTLSRASCESIKVCVQNPVCQIIDRPVCRIVGGCIVSFIPGAIIGSILGATTFSFNQNPNSGTIILGTAIGSIVSHLAIMGCGICLLLVCNECKSYPCCCHA